MSFDQLLKEEAKAKKGAGTLAVRPLTTHSFNEKLKMTSSLREADKFFTDIINGLNLVARRPQQTPRPHFLAYFQEVLKKGKYRDSNAIVEGADKVFTHLYTEPGSSRRSQTDSNPNPDDTKATKRASFLCFGYRFVVDTVFWVWQQHPPADKSPTGTEGGIDRIRLLWDFARNHITNEAWSESVAGALYDSDVFTSLWVLKHIIDKMPPAPVHAALASLAAPVSTQPMTPTPTPTPTPIPTPTSTPTSTTTTTTKPSRSIWGRLGSALRSLPMLFTRTKEPKPAKATKQSQPTKATGGTGATKQSQSSKDTGGMDIGVIRLPETAALGVVDFGAIKTTPFRTEIVDVLPSPAMVKTVAQQIKDIEAKNPRTRPETPTPPRIPGETKHHDRPPDNPDPEQKMYTAPIAAAAATDEEPKDIFQQPGVVEVESDDEEEADNGSSSGSDSESVDDNNLVRKVFKDISKAREKPLDAPGLMTYEEFADAFVDTEDGTEDPDEEAKEDLEDEHADFDTWCEHAYTYFKRPNFAICLEWFTATGFPAIDKEFIARLYDTDVFCAHVARFLNADPSNRLRGYFGDEKRDKIHAMRMYNCRQAFVYYCYHSLASGPLIPLPPGIMSAYTETYNKEMKMANDEVTAWEHTTKHDRWYSKKSVLKENEITDQLFDVRNSVEKFTTNMRWLRALNADKNFPSAAYSLSLLETYNNYAVELARRNDPEQIDFPDEKDEKKRFYLDVLRMQAVNRLVNRLQFALGMDRAKISAQVENSINAAHTDSLVKHFSRAYCVQEFATMPDGVLDGLAKCMDSIAVQFDKGNFTQLALLPMSLPEDTKTDIRKLFESAAVEEETDHAVGALAKASSLEQDDFPKFHFDVQVLEPLEPRDQGTLSLYPAVQGDFVVLVDIVGDPSDHRERQIKANLELLSAMEWETTSNQMIVLHVGVALSAQDGKFQWYEGDGAKISKQYTNTPKLAHVSLIVGFSSWIHWTVSMAYFRRISMFFSDYDSDYQRFFESISTFPDVLKNLNDPRNPPTAKALVDLFNNPKSGWITMDIVKPVLEFLMAPGRDITDADPAEERNMYVHLSHAYSKEKQTTATSQDQGQLSAIAAIRNFWAADAVPAADAIVSLV